ncbi:MAG: ABC transporter permease [Bacteroidota bacterium]
MNRNFFRHFFRNLIKSGVLNAFNIIGLSLGLTATLLITLYVEHEFCFDSFHPHADQLYRLEAQTNSEIWFANLGIEHARELGNGSYPEVEGLVKFNGRAQGFVLKDGERFAEDKVFQTNVGSTFFDLFGFTFLEGDKRTALGDANNMVITQTIAQKYFGDDDALGETLNYDSTLFTITGVIEDLPTYTHFDFDMLVTNSKLYERQHFHTYTYLKLNGQASSTALEDKILSADVAFNDAHILTAARLVPVTDIHLASDSAFGDSSKGDLLQINVFIVLGILIMIIAAINYVNLSFAIFLNKGKEVGVRKVLGETRWQIILSLSKQAIMTTLLALPLVALGLFFLAPEFGRYMHVDIVSVLLNNPIYLVYGVLLLVVVGLSTVIYPFLALNKMDVGSLMKSGLLLTPSGGVQYRNVLILVQFVFLFTLGISAWFMNQQIQYLDDKDKGFNAHNVIKVENAYEIGDYKNYTLLKNELLANAQVSGVAFGPMMGDNMRPLAYKPEGSDQTYENLLSYGVDIDYFDVMEIDITAGEFKSVLNAAKNGQIVSLVNRSFINRYDWGNDPIGRKIILRPGTENELHRQVSAVFEDFHFYSFKEKITPQIISLRPDPQFINTNILVKATANDISNTMKLVDKAWQKVQPDLPIEMTLMEDAVRKLYIKERQTGKVGIALSVLAMSLSLAGIVGFMFYILGLKSKEIAIRKVLGASISQIVAILNRQLFYTILAAGVIGSTGSYLLVGRWLEDYAYAIAIGPTTFVSTVILVYALVFIIVGFQTVKSTRINPSMVLKEK